jgi:hypothetical protein
MSSHWLTAIDHYCERTDPGFWSEPLNAVSNGAFLIAAAAAFRLWAREGRRDGPALWLVLVAAAVGIGSFLFHTFANRWSLVADVLPIAVFIYSYVFLALRRYLGLAMPAAVFATVAFAVFNMGFERLWLTAVGPITLNGSIGYLPAGGALVIVGGFALASRDRATAGRSLLLAAAIFAVSLTFRSIDHAVCEAVPVGTHFVWHTLNAVVLFVLMRAAIVDGARRATAEAAFRADRVRPDPGRARWPT